MRTSVCSPIVTTKNPKYLRHRPEDTLLYKVVQENVATVFQRIEADGKTLPKFVRQEFDAFLDCGILAKGFLRLRCDSCARELLVAFSCKKRGFCSLCRIRHKEHYADCLIMPTIQVFPNETTLKLSA